MKLRIVREDGTDATLDDVVSSQIQIDGVATAVTEWSGAAFADHHGLPEWRSQRSSSDWMTLVFAYSNHVRSVHDPSRSQPGRTYIKHEFADAFQVRRCERKAREHDVESRRHRERTEWPMPETIEPPKQSSQWSAPSNGMARIMFMGAGLEHARVDVPIVTGDTESVLIDGLATHTKAWLVRR